MRTTAYTASTIHVSLRIYPKYQHHLLLGVAIAKRLNPSVQYECIINTFSTSWLFVVITVKPRTRTAFSSRQLLRSLHFLMDLTRCPLDNISFTIPS